VVGLLEMMGVPYTGASPEALTLCKDKSLAKKILSFHRIKTPRFVLSPKKRPLRSLKPLAYPVFVKPIASESSEGIAQAALAEDQKSALDRVAFLHEKLASDVLIEEYVEGRELYAGVLGNERLKAFPLIELFVGDEPIGAKNAPEGAPKFFTYKAKWDNAYRKRWDIRSGKPRSLSPERAKKAAQLARRACSVLRVNGYARVDLRLTEAGELYVIEVNPNPGLARLDEFAQAAALAGIDYEALIERIVKLGVGRV
jgi:D-alanine-D-alanine ligase